VTFFKSEGARFISKNEYNSLKEKSGLPLKDKGGKERRGK
jgi:hypothetical protein